MLRAFKDLKIFLWKKFW